MREPVILHTISDGTRWGRSAIDGVPSDTSIRSVLCTRGETAWAATINLDGGIGSLLLHSTDGGATWAPAITSLGERTQLRGLARSTKRN